MAMDFIDQIKQFSKRVESMKDNISTEEATKTSLIMPFFALLGYDVFNPEEFVPEFTADVGIKKGEKVDYAILMDGKPAILVEAKWIGESLAKHDSQLFRYFATTQAKFAILTNGCIYRFYTDLDESNKMDEKPFLEINMLDIKESQVSELKKFCKANFNLDEILDTASQLKYSNAFKSVLANELQNPSDDLTRHFLSGVYSGVKTQAVIDKFRPVLKKAMNDYVSEMMSERLKSVLTSTPADVKPEKNTDEETQEPVAEKRAPQIETTVEELGAYFLVKNLLKEIVSTEEVTYKDTTNYFSILYQNNIRKWVCRFVFTTTQKTLVVPDENKKEIRFILENIYDIEKYKDQIIQVLRRYIKS